MSDRFNGKGPENVDDTRLLLEEQSQKAPVSESARPPAPKASQCLRLSVLLALTLQNSIIILFMKQSSRMTAADGHRSISTTTVAVVEVAKVILCLGAVTFRRGSFGGLLDELNQQIIQKEKETLLLLVPAFIYTLQNNLLFVAIANLEPALYMVTSQLKILTTAFFSVLILSRKLTIIQWLALILLACGCAVVQYDGEKSKPMVGENRALGLMSTIICVVTSGFTGVYIERLLKTGAVDMAIRNIQLGVPSVVLSLVGVYIQDGVQISEYGFFQGYTWVTWVVIALHSVGGLLVTAVMTYADNIAKTFAVALALIISSLASFLIFNTVFTWFFVIGSGLVLTATFLYASIFQALFPILLRALGVSSSSGAGGGGSGNGNPGNGGGGGGGGTELTAILTGGAAGRSPALGGGEKAVSEAKDND